MDALRLPPGDADVATLSGGEKRRVALCRLLLEQPDLLLLDEPTNHLDAESVAWLERHLAEFPGTVVAVTHDRYFLDNVAEWILELDRGAGDSVEGQLLVVAGAEAEAAGQRGEAGLRAAAHAAARARVGADVAPGAPGEEQGARGPLRGDARRGGPACARARAEILIPRPPRLGDEVVIAKGLTKGYGDRLLFENLDFALPRGGIVGVIGPNGAGKTTLFRMIVGQETAGRRHARPSARPSRSSYVDQSRDALDAAKTVYEEISGGAGRARLRQPGGECPRLLRRVQLPGHRPAEEGGHLSGGERNRLHLAKLLKSGGNLLLLDEPTNDLDVDTLRALEDALVAFAGCAVVISHDRWFLDRIATHILAFEGDSEVVWFEGNYQDYAADFQRRKGTVGGPAAPDQVQEAGPLAPRAPPASRRARLSTTRRSTATCGRSAGSGSSRSASRCRQARSARGPSPSSSASRPSS